MSIWGTLWRREALSAARSSLSWILVSGFATATGMLLLLSLHAAEGSIQTLQTLYARVLVFTLPLFCALATMRSFAEERQSGTIETLLTAPVSDAQVVWAKFTASLLQTLAAIVASLIGFVLYVETAMPAPVYSRTGLAYALLVILLHAAAWCAVGILASLLTHHQAAAAITGLLFSGPHGLLASGMTPGIVPSNPLDALSVTHVARGVLDSRPVLLCLSVMALFLFVSIRSLEARRWKL